MGQPDPGRGLSCLLGEPPTGKRAEIALRSRLALSLYPTEEPALRVKFGNSALVDMAFPRMIGGPEFTE